MPSFEPIQQFPAPTLADSPDGPAQISAVNSAAVPRVNMRFSSIAQRDARLPNPVDGMECFTGTGAAGKKWIFVNGQWNRMYYMPRVDKYDVLTGNSSWKITRQDFHVHNAWVMANATIERQDFAFDPPADGNITNTTVATVHPDWIPKSWFALHSGENGRICAWSISNDGRIRLNAVAGTDGVEVGDILSVRGIYHLEL